jgi:hypothetical protein
MKVDRMRQTRETHRRGSGVDDYSTIAGNQQRREERAHGVEAATTI